MKKFLTILLLVLYVIPMVFQLICGIVGVPWISTLKLYVVFLTYINQLDLVLIFVPRQKDIRQCCINTLINRYSQKGKSVAAVTTSYATNFGKSEYYTHLPQQLTLHQEFQNQLNFYLFYFCSTNTKIPLSLKAEKLFKQRFTRS